MNSIQVARSVPYYLLTTEGWAFPEARAMNATSISVACRNGAGRSIATVLPVSLALAALLVYGSHQTFGDNGASSLLSITCWILVVAGVTGTTLASNGNRYGWLLLFSLQPLWIAYALCTDQPGLIFGSLAYGAAQLNGLLMSWRQANGDEK
jgi:hypothetical protein